MTWNSDPLNTSLALQHMRHEGALRHPIGTSRHRQPSSAHMNRAVRLIVLILWFLVPLILIGAITAWAVNIEDHDLSFISTKGQPPPAFWNGAGLGRYDLTPKSAVNIFFVAGVQLIYTVALHIAEQLANLFRDETAWRRAGDLRTGAQIGKGPTKAALTAWPTLFLLVLKPVSHWIFGLSFAVDMNQHVYFHPLPLFTLTGMALLLALFATYLAYQKPRGPQPATYGDFKRLAQLIDDWGDGAGSKLYWGDKGEVGEFKQAGTSSVAKSLTGIETEGTLYVGMLGGGKYPKETSHPASCRHVLRKRAVTRYADVGNR